MYRGGGVVAAELVEMTDVGRCWKVVGRCWPMLNGCWPMLADAEWLLADVGRC